MSATQSRLGAAARKARSTRSSQTRTPGHADRRPAALAGDQARDAGLAHQPLDALAADPLAVGEDAARRGSAAIRRRARLSRVDLADALGQPRVLDAPAPTAAALAQA